MYDFNLSNIPTDFIKRCIMNELRESPARDTRYLTLVIAGDAPSEWIALVLECCFELHVDGMLTRTGDSRPDYKFEKVRRTGSRRGE
jgi:hypothetical protein